MPTNSLTASNLATGAAGVRTAAMVTKHGLSASILTTTKPVGSIPAIGYALVASGLATSAAALGKAAMAIRLPAAAALATAADALDTPGVSFPNIPIVRSSSSTPYGSRTNITVPAPAGVIDNDILLAFVVNSQIGAERNSIIGPASGFSQVGTDQIVSNVGGTLLRGAVYWKRAFGESGDYTFTTASGNSEVVLLAISRAITADTAIDGFTQASGSVIATSTTAGSTESTTAVATSVTTSLASDLAIYLTSAFSGYSASAPAGISTLLNDIQNGVIFAGWEPEPVIGATGDVAMHVNSSANAWLAYLVCIKSNAALNALTSNSLASGAAGLGTPAFNKAGTFTALPIISGADALDTPVIRQTHVIRASYLNSAAAGLGTPAFNRSGTFTALSISAAAASLGTPTIAVGGGNVISLPSANALTTGRPTLVTTPAFGVFIAATANALMGGAAGIGTPSFNQSDALTAVSLTPNAAVLGQPVLAQTLFTLTAIPLATQAAGLAQALFAQTNFVMSSAADFVVTSPTLDTAPPALTLTATYGLSANALATAPDAFDRPSIVQQQALSANSIASGGAGIGLTQFVQFNLLTATNLATGADYFDTPYLNSAGSSIAAQVNLASVDNNIHQLNTAVTGITPQAAFSAASIAAMATGLATLDSADLSAQAGILIANKAALAVAAAWAVQEQQLLPGKASLAGALALRGNAGTFIFDAKSLASIVALQANLVARLAGTARVIPVAVLAAGTAVWQRISNTLVGNTTLYADAIKPVTQQWLGSALLSPASQLIGIFTHTAAATTTLGPSSSISADISPSVYGITALQPTSTLHVLATAELQAAATGSAAASAAISEAVLAGPFVVLPVTTTTAVRGSLWENTNSLFGVNANLGIAMLLPKAMQAILTPAVVASSTATLRSRFTHQLAAITALAATELQWHGPRINLALTSALDIQLQDSLATSSLLSAQSSLSSNDRLLPFGTAFYWAQTSMPVKESLWLTSQAQLALQPELTVHEGLRLLQSPMIASVESILVGGEYVLHRPFLELPSNIQLNIETPTNYAASKSRLSSLIGFENEIVLWLSAQTAINSDSTMPARSHMTMAGVSDMAPGCFIDPDMLMQRTVEVSAIITAQKTRNRIVAQGNLLRVND